VLQEQGAESRNLNPAEELSLRLKELESRLNDLQKLCLAAKEESRITAPVATPENLITLSCTIQRLECWWVSRSVRSGQYGSRQ
jgi:hypothetical protein